MSERCDSLEGTAGLEPFDEVCLSGTSTLGHSFTDLRGVVAIVDRRDNTIKVWPNDGEPDPAGAGKIWFRIDAIASLQILSRGNEP